MGTIANQMMGADAFFPGPPLPSTGLRRNHLILLGSYLANLQFTIQRLLPFMYRTSELMQREGQMHNPEDRAETQEMANQIGKALEELARASAASAHLFSNLRIGEAPGQFRVSNNARPEFQPFVDDVLQSSVGATNMDQAATGMFPPPPRRAEPASSP